MSAQSNPTHENLTEQEITSFNAFKEKCRSNGLLERPTDLMEHDASFGINDEPTLLRFLRARKFEVEDAYKQFSEASAAREKTHLNTFYDNLNVEDFEATRQLYPHWTGRRDKRGFPLFYLSVGLLNSKNLAAHRKVSESIRVPGMDLPPAISMDSLRSFAFYDYVIRFLFPLCSAIQDRPNPLQPITQSVILVDISTITLMQVWGIRSWIIATSKLFADIYPELLDRIFIIGAPSYFPTIWSWVKGWIDPVIASKILILKAAEVTPTLTSYIDVANIPKGFGGEFDFDHGKQPDLDAAIKATLTWLAASDTSLPKGPIKWVERPEGGRTAVAVGKESGRRRSVPLAHLWSDIPVAVAANSSPSTTLGQE